MTQLYAQTSQQGVWMALGSPQSAAFMLGQALTVTYGDGTQDSLSAHVPAVTSAGTTQVDRTGAVWLLYVVHGDPTLRIVREMDQATIAGSYAPLARVLADRVVPYQPDNGQAQSSTSAQSFLPLTVTNTSGTQSIGGSSSVPVATSSTDYVVQCHLSGSTATSVWNALSDKTSFTDLQVIFAGAEIDADIDQQTNGAWSSSNQTLWFKLQRPIAASAIDQGYQLRMGGGLRSSPPRSWANIYPLADDFLGSSLDATKWTNAGGSSAAVSGSVLTVSASSGGAQGVQSLATFSSGYHLAVYGTLRPASVAAATLQAVGFRDNPASPSYLAQVYVTSTAYGARSYSTAEVDFTPLAALDNAAHVIRCARDASGTVYGWLDSSSIVGTSQAQTHALPAGWEIDPNGNPGTTSTADWIKVRPWISAEPTVSAGTLQSAGALVWQPITDSTGSVLVDGTGNPIMTLSSL